MSNPFLEALKYNFVYECKDKTITLSNEETSHASGKFFVVVCDKCCSIPVFHLLTKEE
jgi:hypothetical protein